MDGHDRYRLRCTLPSLYVVIPLLSSLFIPCGAVPALSLHKVSSIDRCGLPCFLPIASSKYPASCWSVVGGDGGHSTDLSYPATVRPKAVIT